MKNETTKNERRKYAIISVIIVLIDVAAIICISISFVTDSSTHSLAIGMGLTFIGNALGMVTIRKKKGKDDGSSKDRSIS